MEKVVINLNVSVNALSVNGRSISIRRHRSQTGEKDYTAYKIHTSYDIEQLKGWKIIGHANTNQKIAEVAILISVFEARSVIGNKEEHFIIKKFHQEGIIILKFYI